jgi:hypothetical protein
MSADHNTHYEYDRPAANAAEWTEEIVLDGILATILSLLAWFVFAQIYSIL